MYFNQVSLLFFFLFATPAASKLHRFPLRSTGVERDLNRGLDDHTERIASLYQGYATHYVDIWVGSPEPQRQTVIVDTGSSVTAFPCKGCKDCGAANHTDGYYEFTSSKTFKIAGCDDCSLGSCQKTESGQDYCFVSVSYLEGSSWQAFEAKDRVYTGGMHDKPVDSLEQSDSVDPALHASEFAFDMSFGCQLAVKGSFGMQLSDGIMGMDNREGSMWKQMYDAGQIDRKVFSMCFKTQREASKKGTVSGAMTMGGSDEHLWKTPVVYVKNHSPNDRFYSTRVRSFYLLPGTVGDIESLDMSIKDIASDDTNIKKINIPQRLLDTQTVVVDSGTTFSYFHTSLEAPFKAAVKDIVGVDVSSETPFDLTDEQVQKFPTVLIQLHGVDNENLNPDETPGLAGVLDPENKHDAVIAMPPLHYLVYDPRSKGYLFRIFFNDNPNGFLGASAMEGHDVMFDIENGRIGFAESDCGLS